MHRYAAMVVLASGCSDPVAVVGGGTGSSSGEGTSTGSAGDSEASSSNGELDSSSSGPMTPTAECGNGMLEFGEDCDDAKNGDPDDGCTDDCTLPRCGDGWVQPSLGEACDAGPDGDVFCGTQCGSRHTLQWLEVYGTPEQGEDFANGVALDGAGNVVAVGGVDATGEGAIGRDLWVRKYDPAGAEIWTRTHDSAVGASNDAAMAVSIDADGNVYVAGITPVMGNGDDGIVLAFDPDGTPLWTVTNQGSGGSDDNLAAITATADGRVLVAGYVYDDAEPDVLGWYALLDASDGAVLFSETIVAGPNAYARLTATAVGPNGELAVAGVANDDVLVRVLEPDGSERWSLDFDAIDQAEDAARGIAFTPEGDLLVAGAEVYAYLRRFAAADGAEVWSQVYGYEETSARDVVITSDGVVVMIGDDSSVGVSGRTPVLFGIDPADGSEVWRNFVLGGGVVGSGVRLGTGPGGAFAAVGFETPHIFEGNDLWVASYLPN